MNCNPCMVLNKVLKKQDLQYWLACLFCTVCRV